VGSGLVGWSVLAKVAGVPTPHIDAVINIVGGLTKRDFFVEGRNLRNRAGRQNVAKILELIKS
jgi:hypothetical protein